MDRKAQKSLDGSSEKNPNVSSSAEKTEEADYVNVAEVAAKNITSIPVHFIAQSELKQLEANQTMMLEEIYNLTDLTKQLSSDFNIQVHYLTQERENLIQEKVNLIQEKEKLKQEKENLTQEKENLTKEKENLILQSQNLTTELDELNKETAEQRREKKNLTELIETMKKTWNEQNVSRAQWSIDEYCPKENKRNCSSCQKHWQPSQSSCYAVNYVEPQDSKTWKEAQEDCRGKSSDLTVVGNEEEKKFVKDKSWTGKNIKGYWIGLRAEGGKWRWIDGSDLTNQAWIQQQPVDGQCVTSLWNREWRSESCDEKNAWICEKKALSV